jgi:hypothetical protein
MNSPHLLMIKMSWYGQENSLKISQIRKLPHNIFYLNENLIF